MKNKICECGHPERDHRWDLEPVGECCITEPNSIYGKNCKCKKFKEKK